MKNFKNIGFFALMWLLPTILFAQEIDQDQTDDVDLLENTNTSTFVLGNGLNLNMNQGDYSFKISGMLRPSYTYDLPNMDSTATNALFINAARINLEGVAVQEKVSFFIEADFVNSFTLYEAWAAYHFNDRMKLSFGQKLTFTNGREYAINESRLSMVDRSALSNTFATNGREFGLFFESSFDVGSVVINPSVAITSGDGMNSFGNNSIDVDKGGFKYGGRVEVLPLGEFSGKDGQLYFADFEREESVKLSVAGTFSYNVGASHRTGDGHGEFILYDEAGKEKYPNYGKFYVDLLLKYNGISFSADYVNAFARSNKDIYSSPQAVIRFTGEEVSSKYILGSAFNTQLGYLFETGWGVSARYSSLLPEYEEYSASLLQKEDWYTFGVSKYIKRDALKLQAMGSFIDGKDMVNPVDNSNNSNDRVEVKFVAQVIF
ncbi:OprO/OprP family phosphate-selective porin [Flammeovirga yaeyamensis]|uniref:OprO/OprP family phosphate-selective porin n=1 Tax=Flammeovirga yaeyamensis TaxID=367791 RepID=A0AAX1N0L2_9BACT|nr:porin [Flammeovirga yaeyamensis]MBB3698623.1 hypothetical protein [Flammeovirga yaeyamensis]NMF34029.1 hypothetical protein [Flammeovirga yaeyamensis]QWG01017.1 OprO/OprP family phosphate-selective porin [Flammeovirga yaeyamensis]